MTLNQRWKSVKDFYICRTCLRSHTNQRCSVEKRCGESGCMYKHHRLLHKHDNEKLNLLHENRTTADGNLHNFKNFSTLFRVVPITIFGKNINCDTFALLYDGSSVTLMDAGLADYLQLEGDVDPLCLKWTSNMRKCKNISDRQRQMVRRMQHPYS